MAEVDALISKLEKAITATFEAATALSMSRGRLDGPATWGRTADVRDYVYEAITQLQQGQEIGEQILRQLETGRDE